MLLYLHQKYIYFATKHTSLIPANNQGQEIDAKIQSIIFAEICITNICTKNFEILDYCLSKLFVCLWICDQKSRQIRIWQSFPRERFYIFSFIIHFRFFRKVLTKTKMARILGFSDSNQDFFLSNQQIIFTYSLQITYLVKGFC